MTSYCMPVLKCPICSGQFIIYSSVSGNTSEGMFYTDGYIKAPMFDPVDELLECPECAQYIWRAESEEIKVYSENEYRNETTDTNLVNKVSAKKYFDALQKSVWNSNEQEIYLRTRVWWTFNDLFRKDQAEGMSKQLEQYIAISLDKFRHLTANSMAIRVDDAENLVENLWFVQHTLERINSIVDIIDVATPEFMVANQERLLELLLAEYKHISIKTEGNLVSEPENLLLQIAEIYRELGRFQDCVDTLKNLTKEEYRNKANIIRKLAQSGDCQVGSF